MIKLIVCSMTILLLTSCLRTRSDIGYQRPGSKSQPYTASAPTQQKKSTSHNAPPATTRGTSSQQLARLQIGYQEINSQIRDLNGRLDAVEKHLSQLSLSQDGSGVDGKLKNYETALASLEAEIRSIKKGMSSDTLGAIKRKSGSKKLSSFDMAESKFKQKNWRSAISEYQLYREKNPRSKNYPEATYKIGVCFQELNMKAEAKSFYQEAVQKFPSSKAAKKSKFRLKQL